MGSCSFHLDGNHSSFHPGRNYIRLPPLHPATAITPGCRHYTRLPPLSTRNSTAADIPPGCFTFGILTPDGRGGRFNFPGQTYLDPLIALTRRPTDIFRYFSAQCCGVLLKLPDMCDRHLEIFCFRYLMSKSPNSPCNPPIIRFLSH